MREGLRQSRRPHPTPLRGATLSRFTGEGRKNLDYFPILCFIGLFPSAEDASGAVLMCGRGAALALCGNTDPRTRVRLCEAGRDQKRLARPGPAARPGAI